MENTITYAAVGWANFLPILIFFVISFIAFNGMTDLYGGAVTHHNRSVGQGPPCQYL